MWSSGRILTNAFIDQATSSCAFVYAATLELNNSTFSRCIYNTYAITNLIPTFLILHLVRASHTVVRSWGTVVVCC